MIKIADQRCLAMDFAMVAALANAGPRHEAINVVAPIGSPSDLQYLTTVFRDFGLDLILFSDYSETSAGRAWRGAAASTAIRRSPARASGKATGRPRLASW